MKYLENLKEMLCKELEEFAKKDELSAGSLETIHKLTDTIKNIDKIEMLEEDEYSERRYSRDGDWMARGTYANNMSYDGENSYARRKRDNMGRYSREGGYSREGAKEHMISKIEEMMHNTESDKERQALRHCINQLENA